MTTRKTTIITSLALILSLAFGSCNGDQTHNDQKENTEVSQKLKKPGMDIHAATFMGNMKALKENIAYGSDLNSKDAYGSTALNIASTFGKTDIALELIKAGADINATSADGSTPLHTAAFFCRTEIVKALLAANADKTIINQYQSTALESVSANWEEVKPIYEQIAKDLGALGLRLDLERIKNTRPEIAKLLK
jgi:ankyrin repeat protein